VYPPETVDVNVTDWPTRTQADIGEIETVSGGATVTEASFDFAVFGALSVTFR
jgi:hypothetical protein